MKLALLSAPSFLLAPVLLLAGCTAGPEPGRVRPQLAAAAPAGPPSFVVVLVDNLDATTSPYWEALPRTRALVAERGRVFENAFVSNPICSPSRSSILTGQYPHNHGVMNNGGPRGGFSAFRAGGGEERSVARSLQAAGYRTAMIGKYLNGYEEARERVPPGWTRWFIDVDTNLPNGFDYTVNDDGTLRRYGSEPADYNTDVFAAKAVEFIESSAAEGAPFFAFLTVTAPHVPIAAPPRHAGHPWEQASVPRRPNHDEADLSDKPEWLRRSEPARRRLEPWNHMDFRNRMGSLLAVDDLVERVFAALDATGRRENTWVIFASDNGYNLGAHALIHMMAPYEESIRVPLAVTGPEVAIGDEARMVLLLDLPATLLELAGLPLPAHHDGRSLAPLLRGRPPAAWRDEVLIQYETGWAHRGLGWGLSEPAYFAEQILGGQDIPSYRALRTPRHSYIEWRYDDGSGPRREHELYDLEADPYQLDNRLATPAGRRTHAALRASLQERLEALSACAGETCRRRASAARPSDSSSPLPGSGTGEKRTSSRVTDRFPVTGRYAKRARAIGSSLRMPMN